MKYEFELGTNNFSKVFSFPPARKDVEISNQRHV
jgi:hypothetical protein